MKKNNKRIFSILSIFFCINGLLVSCKPQSFSSDLSISSTHSTVSQSSEISSELNYNSSFVSSSSSEQTSEENENIQYQIYMKARDSGFTGTYEEWLESIRGDSIEIRVEDNVLQWKYTKSTDWESLIDFYYFVGADGLSAYQIYKKYYPDYQGTEKEWIDSFVSNNTTTEEYIPDGLRWEYYSYNGKKSISITGYTGFNSKLVIPSIIDGCQVREIQSSFFDSNIYEVHIPSTIVRFEYGKYSSNSITKLYYSDSIDQWDYIFFDTVDSSYVANDFEYFYYLENDEWKLLEKVNYLPAAWEESQTYKAFECSVSLVPGSIMDVNDATKTNAHAKPLSDYLNMPGARYFDLRDVSEGYGAGHVQGFESVSYFRTIVGRENQLFYTDANGKYVARYEESVSVLNKIFPKDATLFVMCQVGGRVQPFLKLLAQYDYDMSKVYNVGGWNQLVAKTVENYGGYNVSLGIGASAITYDFSGLTPVEAQ